MTTTAAQTLVVPVDVVAFCVGQVDAQEATSGFAGTTAVYRDPVTPATQAFLGANVARTLAVNAYDPLEQGVHLHWALPDALTHAEHTEGSPLQFPTAPNRWLVSRLVINGATPAITSWVVESDALSPQPPAGQKAVTIPVKPGSPAAATGQNYNYMGRATSLASYSPPPVTANTPRGLLTATNNELTAVANGMPTFSSFYPDCRSVFGYCDTLSDISTLNGPVELMYVITGWFDALPNDPATPDAANAYFADEKKKRDNDPANPGGIGTKVDPETPANYLRKKLRWGAADAAAPAASVYSGFVQKVSWSSTNTYIHQTAGQLPVQAEVAIGNSPAEVLSAYFAAKDQPDVPLFEQLLNALQFGFLDKLAQPQPDQLAQLREQLHEKEFATIDGGIIYAVVKADPSAKMIDLQADEANLPLKLADDLNDLNILQQQVDLADAHLAEFRWQLFADWYRISLAADDDTRNAAFRACMMRYSEWSQLNTDAGTVRDQRDAQKTLVQGQVETGFTLKTVPASRYWQPTEPSVLVSSPDLTYPSRYGGDAHAGTSGTLPCRTSDQVVTAVAVSGQAIAATQFASVTQAVSAATQLPFAGLCASLVNEACLLNTTIASSITSQSATTLATALGQALAGQTQSVYTATGTLPSTVAATWWNDNPWLPIFLRWTASMLPVQPTAQGDNVLDYPTSFFTNNYAIDPLQGGFVKYSSTTPVDPTSGAYTDVFHGYSFLSPVAARHFASQLTDFVTRYQDATLSQIIQQLGASNILVQSLNGLAQALIGRQQSLQLPVHVLSSSHYAQITSAVQPIVELTDPDTGKVDRANRTSPLFQGPYDPIRAGYLTLTLEAVDAYGQRRQIQFPSMTCASSMVTTFNQNVVPSVAYLPPRLAQPARLLFRWISADSASFDEMNSHPATSPICGWLLPDHLQVGFFIYDQRGRPLGTLLLNGSQTEILWQSAPGNDATINQPVDVVMQDVHPALRDLSVSLKGGTVDFFRKFWQAVDSVHGSINPSTLSASSGLGILVGRPVALAQASLRLEVKGRPALNQSWTAFTAESAPTENGFSDVQFPVVLGDLQQWDDGLVGFFKQNGTGYDLSTFYTEGAAQAATSGVVQPVQNTITLTTTPKAVEDEPPALGADTQKVLMLVDPRARVHATMGILPTQTLQVPPDLASDALSQLEMSFLIAPVLRRGGVVPGEAPQVPAPLALPLPKAPGYQISWVEQAGTSDAPTWQVMPQIDPPSGKAVWAYTPQNVAEGWLRFNPTILEFTLLDAVLKRPLVTAGAPNAMTLTVANKKPGTITFNPGTLVNEGDDANGSAFYIHFGGLVAQTDVPKIGFAADGWTFQSMTDTRYGQYWAATPTNPVTIAPGASVSIGVTGIVVAPDVVQGQVYFDYYNLDGASDGVGAELLAVQSKST